MMSRRFQLSLIVTLLGALAAPQDNPFAPPRAKPQPAPISGYDLLDLKLDLRIDYPKRLLTAEATNTLIVTGDPVGFIPFHVGQYTVVDSAQVNGVPASFDRHGEDLLVRQSATKGSRLIVKIRYHFNRSDAPSNREQEGWHWNDPEEHDPSRTGFWTKGEPNLTREWAVTWDYPNDFATTETRTTVPKDWDVISNGVMVSDTDAPGGDHTVVWRFDKPHATYLTSVVAGPMEIQQDNWKGLPLMYVAPRGPEKGSAATNDRGFDLFMMRRNDGGRALAYTCEHTKGMLAYFTKLFGVSYPWPMYAQTFTYDHNSGMENVSATTLGNFLTSPRQSRHGADLVLAHELAHQWFGNLVTCQDWGQLWLNESFAVFGEMAWCRQSRGLNAFQRALGYRSLGYFGESRGYARPLSVGEYGSPEDMFDQHSYSKGGILLHSLRVQLGDRRFFAGIRNYLSKRANRPTSTADLCSEMSEGAGVDLRPWFDQWIAKPGHPVIDWSWSWNETRKEVELNLRQVQDRSKGTPIYDVPIKIGLIYENDARHVVRKGICLSSDAQRFTLRVPNKPDAVIIDPDHELLRQIKANPWSPAEMRAVARFGPDCFDRQAALTRLLTLEPTDTSVRVAVELLSKDRGFEPAFTDLSRLAAMKRVDLRSFWEAELAHQNFGRQQAAISALADLPPDPITNLKLRALVSEKQAYEVAARAIGAIGKLDYSQSRDLILRLARESEDRPIRVAALQVLLANSAPEAVDLVFKSVEPTEPFAVQSAGFEVLIGSKFDDPRLIPLLRDTLNSDNFYGLTFDAVAVARGRKLRDLVPDLRNLAKRVPFGVQIVEDAIKEIEG